MTNYVQVCGAYEASVSLLAKVPTVPNRPEPPRPTARPTEDKLTPDSKNGFGPILAQISPRQTLTESIYSPNPRS